MNKCYFCESTEQIEAHHIDKNYKNQNPENFVLLCKKCHHRLHSKIYRPLEKGIRERRLNIIYLAREIKAMVEKELKEYES